MITRQKQTVYVIFVSKEAKKMKNDAFVLKEMIVC